MENPVILLFSREENNIKRCFSELNKQLPANESIISFNSYNSIYKWIAEHKKYGIAEKLFILNIDDTDEAALGFVNHINQICPYSIKIIIAGPEQLVHLFDQAENNTSLIFLNQNWTSWDFQLSLGMALKADDYLKLTTERNREKTAQPLHSEEKLMQKMKDLMESNNAKDRFLSIIAHDLKNPFNALLGLSEILTKNWDYLEEKDKLEIVSDIRKTTENTFGLLIDLLEWAKSQQESWVVQTDTFDIHPLIETTLSLSESNANPKKISIYNDVKSGTVVTGDKNLISTVFRNLVNNAVKYIPHGGKIRISGSSENGFCTFCIADNGDGIDKPHILDIFRKGSPQKINGNLQAFKGLGLLICKEFIDKSGGQIWLETEKGKGSKFFFTVPSAN